MKVGKFIGFGLLPIIFMGAQCGPQMEETSCSRSHHIREGLNVTLSSLKGLQSEKALGHLTDETRKSLCADLSKSLSDIMEDWRHREFPDQDKLDDLDNLDGSMFHLYELDHGQLRNPDQFFFDAHNEEVSFGDYPRAAGVSYAYVDRMIKENLVSKGKECVPGDRWVTGPDGSKKLEHTDCLTQKDVEVHGQGYDQAVALRDAIHTFGLNLGKVCGSGYYYWQVNAVPQPNGTWYYGDVGALKVDSKDFDDTLDQAITGIENDILSNGVAAYQAIKCEANEAFALLNRKPGGTQRSDADGVEGSRSSFGVPLLKQPGRDSSGEAAI
ncbi:MAG TPA: hypothetical protein VL588_00215 [Bdellovibrionota bacterium]|jgi:hypothetical protein|nr:hypothetical protein [Bdellovibrionota bacterium]